MKCPECKADNPDEAKFCGKCGERLSLVCPECGSENKLGNNFCNSCGLRFKGGKEPQKIEPAMDSERKYVTVLFSDLSGYTSMSEKLDPEEVKEVINRIFGEIAQVVTRYEGFIEKFIGDAVMALFGVPKTHEDDPVRAIRVAREIHDIVEKLSPEIEKRTGQSISMHTGINTGLVVTGEVDMEKGTHNVSGDTINLASRLSSLAKAGEILVDPDTCRQSEGYYTFEELEPTEVKGKEKPIELYRVLLPKDKPVTIHRLSGLRADLTGREAEISQLKEAVDNLRTGKGRIFSICGDAGSGKSRLVEEFKRTLDLNEFQWVEGHAYAYSQNIPYFPLMDLLNRAFGIEESDSPEKIRIKLEIGIDDLIGSKEDLVPYVGGLYSLHYPEVADIGPDFWKARLQEAMIAIFAALAKRYWTVFFLDDLHWADPSFIELLRNALTEIREAAIVLCVYRPVFSLFTSHMAGSISKIYQEMRLQDLSFSEAETMLKSLLKAETIPPDLRNFVQDKTEGNPFYLEELINSLIESETLIRENGNWIITRQIAESDIPLTIHGLISGRLDRLEKETKRILQEASVIGRSFLYDILKRVTELKDRIDLGLNILERLDLIRTRSFQPDLEYMFKHPLTQEVVYNGLLKKDRQIIHEQIALVMEQLFKGRLPEFYETLAFHFKQGQSVSKAVDYLMKSGDKSVGKYAVEEAHQYYKEAFDILTSKPDKALEEIELLIDLLIKWALVFYHRGDFGGLDKLLTAHEELAKALEDKARMGMFYAWLGFVVGITRGNPRISYEYLINALELGEAINEQRVIGYACTWLVWTCADWGRLDEAIAYGERAEGISKKLKTDHYLFYKSMAGIAQTYWFKGECEKVSEIGNTLFDYGRNHSNIRSLVVGHIYSGTGYLTAGDYQPAIERYRKAIDIAADPFYSHWSRIFLALAYFYNEQFDRAEEAALEIMSYCTQFSCEYIRPYSSCLIGALMIIKGHMSQGLKMIENECKTAIEKERKMVYARLEHTLGIVYLLMAKKEVAKNIPVIAKNIGFLVKEVPFAGKKSEAHFKTVIEVAGEIGAEDILGQAYMGLCELYKIKDRKDEAKECISKAINIFQESRANVYLKQAKEALSSLE